MFIIFRYLAKQLLTSMFAVSGILLLIFMSGRFIKYLSQAASGGISADVLFTLMGYRMPGFLELILPLGLFIGILLAYGRMYLESEMTVLFACGMSERRLVMLTMGTSLIVMFLVGAMSLIISPWGMQNVEQIFRDQSKLTEFEMLAPGRFQALKSGQRVTYTEALSDDKKELQGVFISEKTTDGKSLVLTTAETGTQYVDPNTGSRFLVLHDGKRFQGMPGELEFNVIEFESYGLKIAEPPEERRGRKDESIGTLELWDSSNPKYTALLQWRISLPMLVPIVTLLAISLSRVNPRQGRFFHLFPAMLIYITYLGLLIVARNALGKEKIPAWVGVWWVHLLFFAIAMGLLGKGAIVRRWRSRNA
ncbi:LPS export ABC transporter permease LptF [Alkalimarinus coralli]|uniref:LPS export ABC transporter permease LptF n=1 Tax=Alkalimarinus coralli TaxID=2935863 RepID=UPI00202B5987|nr:LPS export ABC transporter permease LptF [Alkalimarinus coralli]